MRYLYGLLLVLTGCGTVTNTPQPLYVYGDSISAGMSQPGYVNMVAGALGLFLVNKSISATQMTSPNQYWLIDWDSVEAWQDGSVIMFAPGVNDAIDNKLSPQYMATYTQDLTKIIKDIGNRSVRAFIGTPTHNCNETRFVKNTIVDLYAEINRQVVAQYHYPNITLVDYNKEFTPTVYNTLECVHPNQQGNKEMFQIFMKVWSL